VARPLDPNIDEAITQATMALLAERGFAGMSMEAIAGAAGVGKPAIYRRFHDKASLVASVIVPLIPLMPLMPLIEGKVMTIRQGAVHSPLPYRVALTITLIACLP
jgi:hypothetical protein